MPGIRIKCVGKSKTQWSETRKDAGDREYTDIFSTSHKFFKQEVTPRGTGYSESNADRITLSAGEHRFPFQFQIPSIPLPAPFEGVLGYVRYYVKFCFDPPGQWDHRLKRLFSIFTVKDLNYEYNVLVPPCEQTEKTVCCLCCASGPIVLKGLIDKRGYVPGEYIFVSLDLQNNSSRRIGCIAATLQQSAHFSASSYGRGTCHRIETKKIAEIKLDGCEAMGTANCDRMKMLIPPIPPCTYDNCPNIQLEYYVTIVADVSGTLLNPGFLLPIVIGTVPAFEQTLKDPTHAPQGIDAYAPYAGQPISVYPPPTQPGGYPPPAQPAGYPPPAQPAGYPPPTQPGYPPPDQPAGYPPPAQPAGYLPPAQPAGYPPPVQHDGYPSPAQPDGYPSPAQPARYPPPGHPGYPPSDQPGYPPSDHQPAHPPPAEQPGYPLPGQPGYTPPDQPAGYPPPAQPAGYTQPAGYPPPGQPGYPPSDQPAYPPPAEQPGYPPPAQPAGYPPPDQPAYPPSAEKPGYPSLGQPVYPSPPGPTGDSASGSPPAPTYVAALGGPKQIVGNKRYFDIIMYAPHYPYYRDPDALYTAMGIPLGAPLSSGDTQSPTVTQPRSVQQPSYNPYRDGEREGPFSLS